MRHLACLQMKEVKQIWYIQLASKTGDAPAKRLPVHRVSFAVWKELAQQLQQMECNTTIHYADHGPVLVF